MCRYGGAIVKYVKTEDVMTDIEFLEREIKSWKHSPERNMQIKGQLYYNGKQDILYRKRTVIGENGGLEPADNLPDNRIVDNQYYRLVNQKADYLLGQPFVLRGGGEKYIRLLKRVFNRDFMKTLLNAEKAALNGGISWLYPCPDSENGISFRMFPAYEILPFWRDSAHTVLDAAARVYKVCRYNGGRPESVEKVEVFASNGINRYILDKNGRLVPDRSGVKGSSRFCHMLTTGADGEAYGYNRREIPLVAVKYNDGEIPLIKRVKALQDGINIMLSDFQNNMQEDPRNTILVLKNYDGTSLGEFRKNLSAFGAVKVRCDGESQGGVETLEIKVNPENYKAILEHLKHALIENGMGYDPENLRRFGGAFSNPGQMFIRSVYTDMDMDANEMEAELQVSFERIFGFLKDFFFNTKEGDFFGEETEVIFNRDMLLNESEVIDDCIKSLKILSGETVAAQHPWVDDVKREMQLKSKEDQTAAQERQ